MKNQKGFIQNLILPALVLIGIALTGLGYISNTSASARAITASVDLTRDQLQQIRETLNWCRVVYPAGDNGVTAQSRNLPDSPVDGSWVSIRDIRCPGDPSSPIWNIAKSMLTKQGPFLADWEYRNHTSGVWVRISAANSNENGLTVIKRVATRLQPGQFSMTGNTLEILISN